MVWGNHVLLKNASQHEDLRFWGAWPMPTGATVCPYARWCSQVASQAFKAMLLVWWKDILVVFVVLSREYFSGIALVNQYCLAFSFLLDSMLSICFSFLLNLGFPYASIRLPYTSHTPPVRSKYCFFVHVFGSFGTQKAQNTGIFLVCTNIECWGWKLAQSWWRNIFRGGWPALSRVFAPKIFPSADVCSGRSNGIQQVIL